MIAVKKIQQNLYTLTSLNLITLEKKKLKKQFSLAHLNISSLQYYFD